MVPSEASRLAYGKSRLQANRAEIIRAISMWYVHVARRNTHPKAILGASVRRWLPKREHHTEVLARMTTSGPALSRGLLAVRRRGESAGLLRPGEEGIAELH